MMKTTKMRKEDTVVVAVANGWSVYKLSKSAWESLSDDSRDKSIPLAVTLDGMVTANMAEKLSHIQMISIEGMDEPHIHDDGGGGFFLEEEHT